MYCENCGALLREHAKFCDQCGRSVGAEAETKKYCSNCHAELEPGALFCPECGYRVVEKPDPEPEPVPDPTPPPDPKPDPKPDPLEQQSSTPPQPLLNIGANAFFAAVIAAGMSALGALWMAEESSWMYFGEAFLLIGIMGLVGWLIAVGFFAIARNYQKAAQRESDPQRQRLLKRQVNFLVYLGYLLVVLAPYVLAFACIYL